MPVHLRLDHRRIPASIKERTTHAKAQGVSTLSRRPGVDVVHGRAFAELPAVRIRTRSSRGGCTRRRARGRCQRFQLGDVTTTRITPQPNATISHSTTTGQGDSPVESQYVSDERRDERQRDACHDRLFQYWVSPTHVVRIICPRHGNNHPKSIDELRTLAAEPWRLTVSFGGARSTAPTADSPSLSSTAITSCAPRDAAPDAVCRQAASAPCAP